MSTWQLSSLKKRKLKRMVRGQILQKENDLNTKECKRINGACSRINETNEYFCNNDPIYGYTKSKVKTRVSYFAVR